MNKSAQHKEVTEATRHFLALGKRMVTLPSERAETNQVARVRWGWQAKLLKGERDYQPDNLFDLMT